MIEFLQVLGGLALFLFGISMLSAGMEKLTGDQIQKWLDRMTSTAHYQRLIWNDCNGTDS